MTDTNRAQLREFTVGLVFITAAIVGLGLAASVFAQTISQDTINATLGERQIALAARLDKIESLLQYAIAGVFGNLVGLLLFLLSVIAKAPAVRGKS